MKSGPKTTESAYVLTMPMGLDVVTAEELAVRARRASVSARSSTEIALTYGGPPSDLAALRSVTDVWTVVRQMAGIGTRYRDLRTLSEMVARTDLEPALARLREMGLRPRRTLRFGITCTMRGERAYRRTDALQAARDVLTGLQPGTGPGQPRVRLVPAGGEAPAVRFWLHLEGDRARLALALTPLPVGVRERAVSLPGSLPGPVAYAMAHLTRPTPNDVFVDPACGSGSIALERAENWRHRLILAGDLDAAAVAAAAANFGPRHKPRDLLQWDAARLPLPAESVDAMACNPPHGIQMRPKGGLEKLYRGILVEASRVLRAGSRMTFLTPERELTDRILADTDRFRIERCFVIDLLGQRPYLYSLRRS